MSNREQPSSGAGVTRFWICDFTDASLGPRHELQFSIFVARQPVRDIPAHPLSLLAAMLTRPAVQMLCHGLWNNTPTVVAYNRKLLSLNARLTQSTITRNSQEVRFEFCDAVSGAPILAGCVHKPQQPAWRASFALLGLGQTVRLSRQPWAPMAVVNPLGVGLAHNGVAQAMSKNAVNKVRYFDLVVDSLTTGDTPYRNRGFTPHFVQYMDGFKFVYLQPE
jgi:hypothetical protein